MGQYRFHLIVGTVLFNILQDPGDFFFKAGDFCQIFTPEICIGAYGMYQIFCGIFFVCIIKFQYGSVVRDGIGISFGTNCLKSGLCQLCAPVELDIEKEAVMQAGSLWNFSTYPSREGSTLALHLEVEFREMDRRA